MIELFGLMLIIGLIAGWRRQKALIEELQRQIDSNTTTLRNLEDRLDRSIQRSRPGWSLPVAAPEPRQRTDAQPTPGTGSSIGRGTWTSAPVSVGGDGSAIGSGPDGGDVSPRLSRPSVEESLGTRWAVWLGGVALALGGLLLVRLSIEQGLLGPGGRVVLGAALSLALVVAGEFFRRRETISGIQTNVAAHIPGTLTAAGTSTAFGTIYAAHALYEFIGPALAFLLLGAVGVATLFAAALHGPALAGLGLVGAYAAPMLVASDKPAPWPLVLYLAVVAYSALRLARLRRWLWLAMVAVVGVTLWGLPFLERMGGGDLDWRLAAYVHGLVQLLLAVWFLVIEPHRGTPDVEARHDPVGAGLVAVLTLLLVLMLGTGRYDITASVPFMLAAAIILMYAGSQSAPVAAAIVMAGAVVLAGVLFWPGLRAPPDTSLLAPAVAEVIKLPENVTTFLLTTAVSSLLVAAWSRMRLTIGHALAPGLAGCYALAATVTPLLALILAYLRITQFDQSIPFALFGGVLALYFAFGAESYRAAEAEDRPGTRLATGAFAVAALAAFAFALVTFLSRGYLTVALAVTATGAAHVASSKGIPLLRHCVTALAAVVLARLAWEPRIVGDSVGSWPILNWLLIGYAIPAFAFWKAARLLERSEDDVAVRLADATAVLLAALLCFFQIRHAVHGDIYAIATGHLEQGLHALTAIGFSYVMLRLDLGRSNPVFRWGSLIAGVVAMVSVLIGLGFVGNPLLIPDRVGGWKVFSTLLPAYLLSGIAAAGLARAARESRPEWFVVLVAVLAALLCFGYVTMEVRHIYLGEWIQLRRGFSGQQEVWAYSAAWLALGILMLWYGIARSSVEARLASAVLVLLAVGKVFLFDLNELSGFWRAFSFIGLGGVLIGIGLVYQNLMFPRARAPEAPGPVPVEPDNGPPADGGAQATTRESAPETSAEQGSEAGPGGERPGAAEGERRSGSPRDEPPKS